MSLRSLSLSSLSAPPTTTTSTTTTPTSALFFFQKLIQSHSPQDIKRIQHVEISKLLIGSSSSSALSNMEQYCSQVFNALIKANNNTTLVDKNSSSSPNNNNNRQSSSTSLDHQSSLQQQQQQQRRDTTIRNVLKELISVQTLLLSSSSSQQQQQSVKNTSPYCYCCFQLSQSLLLFCFKTLLEPSKSFSMDKRIKALCLLLVQNQFNNNQNKNNNNHHHHHDNIENGDEMQDEATRVDGTPSILEQYFSRNDLAEVLVSDVEIVPVVLSLLNMYASEQVMNRHWRETIVRPFVLNAAFSNDQNQQNLSETQLYSLLNIVPFIASVIHRSGNGNGGSHLVDVTTNNVVSSVMTTMASSSSSLVSSDPLIEQMEKVFASWLLRAGTFTEKKKAVFRGGAVSVTELDGSPCSGFFTLLNHTQTFSRRQNVNSILFSVLHTWIRSVHRVEPSLLSMNAQANLSSSLSSSQGMVIGSLQNVPSKLKSSHKKDHLLHRHSYDSLTPPSPILNELHIRAMSPAAHHQTPQDSIAQQQQRQHMPMNNQLLDAIVQYCLRLIQQSELKYNNSRESVRSLFTSSYIESVLVETVRQLDEICTIYPVVVGRVFPSLKKLFHILCNQRILVQQTLLTQQQQQQQQQTQSSTLSPSRRKYQVEKPKLTIKPTKQVPTSEQLLQHSLMTRSNMGCLLICLIEFFIHHIHTLVYDPQPLFQSFFSEQFPYYYREPLFPIELMILFLDNQKIIHYETKLLDDYYPQLFKLMAYSPHQIVEELSVVLPSIISHSNYLDVFHRILDLPMLSFVLDCDSKKLNIQTSDVLNSLFESVVSDNVNALRDFWAKRMLSADWDQMCQQINGILPDVAIQTSECTTKLLETYFSVLLEEENSEELLHELLPILLKRVNTLTPVHRGTYLQDTRKVLLKYFVVVLERWPVFIVDMKNLLLQTLQEVNDDVFVNVCYSIGQSIAVCADARLTTQLIVQYFEALELVTFEQLARARVQKKLSAQRKLADLPSEMEEEFLVSSRYSTQCLNTLISSMVKICGRCPDLVPRVIVCLTNLVKHYDSLHASVVQRANESIRLLRFPSIVTSLFCSAVVTSRNDGK